MKKQLLTIITFAIIGLSVKAQAPAWQWAKSAIGNNDNYGQSIAVDASGNTYITGYFYGSSIIFGSTTLTNAGSDNIFIVKYDVGGNVLWAKSAGGSSYDEGNGIAVDASGNSYVTGYFNSLSITFGSTYLTNAGTSSPDIFIVKSDAGGNVLWAKSAGGSSWDKSYGIAVDTSGTSYVTGYFNSPSITFGSTTLSSAYYDIFIAKLLDGTATASVIGELQDEQGFTIFPNPFTFQTTISFSSYRKNTPVKIMDVVGKEIKTILFSGKSLVIEKGTMQSGIYFVQLTDENNNVVNKKIIIE